MEENQKRNQLREARAKLERTRKQLARIERQEMSMLHSQVNMSEVEVQEMQAQHDRLNFGLKFWSKYDRHDAQEVKGIFWKQQCKDPNTRMQHYCVDIPNETKSHAITSMSYSASNFIYLAISDDFKCHFFNEHFILVRSLHLSNRLLQHCHFLDSSNTLICSGVEGAFLYRLKYECSSHKAQAHKLDPLGERLSFQLKLFRRLQGVQQWVKGIQVDQEMDLLFAWSTDETSVYNLKGDHHFTFENLVEEAEDMINDLLYMPKYRYIVVCSEKGKLIVYKWAAERAAVTSFKGMDRPIKSLVRHNARHNQFLTASVDQTIRIWCLEKFSCQYVLKIPFEFKSIKLFDNLQFAVMERDQVQIGKVQDIVLLMHKSQTNAVCSGQCFIDMEQKRDNYPYALFTQFKDNSIKLLAPKADADIRVRSTVYPPPNAENIQIVRYCSALKQLVVFVASGIIYFYRLEQGVSVMVRQIQTGELRDADSQLLDQKVTVFEIGCLEPARYDCQRPTQVQHVKRISTWDQKKFQKADMKQAKGIGQRESSVENTENEDVQSETTSLLHTDTEEKEKTPDDCWMVMGFHRGQVIIYNIFKMDVPVARYEVCREKILMIKEVLPLKMYLVYDETHLITLCRLTESGTKILHQFNLFKSLYSMLVFNRYVYFGYESGELDFFEVKSTIDSPDGNMFAPKGDPSYINSYSHNQTRMIRRNEVRPTTHQMVRYDLPKMNDSDEGITAITISTNNGVIATADRRGLIKIWNCHKQLMREIQFHEPILSISFIDSRGDLMIGHGSQLSLVTAKQYMGKTESKPARYFRPDQLNELADGCTNDRMYELHSKDAKSRKDDQRRKLVQDDELEGIESEEEEEVKQARRELERAKNRAETTLIVNQEKAKEKQRKKDVRLAREQKRKEFALGRDLPISQAEQKSKELAQKAIDDELKRIKEQQLLLIQKERRRALRKQSQVVLTKIPEENMSMQNRQVTLKKKPTSTSISSKITKRQSSSDTIKTKRQKTSSSMDVSRALSLPKVNSVRVQPQKEPQSRKSQEIQKVLTVLNQSNELSSDYIRAQSSELRLSEEPLVNEHDTQRDYSTKIDLVSDQLADIKVQAPQLPSNFKYNPNAPAVPLEVIEDNFNKIFEGKLHPKRAGQSIRREMTEQRISQNIALYNSATEKIENDDLFIGRLSYDQNQDIKNSQPSMTQYIKSKHRSQPAKKHFRRTSNISSVMVSGFNSPSKSIYSLSNKFGGWGRQRLSEYEETSLIKAGLHTSNKSEIANELHKQKYSTTQLNSIIRRSTHQRKLISELRNRNNLLHKKPSQNLELAKVRAGSMRYLSKVNTKFSLDLNDNDDFKKSTAAGDSVVQKLRQRGYDSNIYSNRRKDSIDEMPDGGSTVHPYENLYFDSSQENVSSQFDMTSVIQGASRLPGMRHSDASVQGNHRRIPSNYKGAKQVIRLGEAKDRQVDHASGSVMVPNTNKIDSNSPDLLYKDNSRLHIGDAVKGYTEAVSPSALASQTLGASSTNALPSATKSFDEIVVGEAYKDKEQMPLMINQSNLYDKTLSIQPSTGQRSKAASGQNSVVNGSSKKLIEHLVIDKKSGIAVAIAQPSHLTVTQNKQIVSMMSEQSEYNLATSKHRAMYGDEKDDEIAHDSTFNDYVKSNGINN